MMQAARAGCILLHADPDSPPRRPLILLNILPVLTAEPGGFKVKAAVRQGGGRRTKAAATPAQGGEEGDGAASSPAGGDSGPAGIGIADKAAGQGEEVEEEDAAAERRVGRSGDPLDDVSAEFGGGAELSKEQCPMDCCCCLAACSLGCPLLARAASRRTAHCAPCCTYLHGCTCLPKQDDAGRQAQLQSPSKAQSPSFY